MLIFRYPVSTRLLWLYGFVLTACILAFYPVIQAFEASSAQMPLDNQFPLSVEAIQTQLQGYSDKTREIYRNFWLLDLAFPPLLSGFFVLVWMRLLQQSRPSQGAAEPWLYLGFLSCAADWSENLCNGWLVFHATEFNEPIAKLSIHFKQIKLSLLLLNLILTAVLFWRLRQHRSRHGN